MGDQPLFGYKTSLDVLCLLQAHWYSDFIEIMTDNKDERIHDAEASIKANDTVVEVVPTMEEQRLDRQTLRRLDLILLPMTLLLYLLAWLDRANIGNARVVRPWSDTLIEL